MVVGDAGRWADLGWASLPLGLIAWLDSGQFGVGQFVVMGLIFGLIIGLVFGLIFGLV